MPVRPTSRRRSRAVAVVGYVGAAVLATEAVGFIAADVFIE
jgi:hypothetical protein